MGKHRVVSTRPQRNSVALSDKTPPRTTPYIPEHTSFAPREPLIPRHVWWWGVPLVTVIVVVAVCVSLLTPHTTHALLVSPATKIGVTHENIVLIGSDSRQNVTDGDAGNATQVMGERADTIMVVSIPSDHSSASVVSIPRDTLVAPAKQCGLDSGTYRINQLFSIGDGRQCLVATIEKVMQLRVTRYAAISMPQLKNIVDKVGGVTLCFSAPMVDDVLGPIVQQAGKTTLNGRQALKFVRARHVDARSDFSRVERQRVFMKAMLMRLSSLPPDRKAAVLSTMVRSVESDGFSLGDVDDMVTILSRLDEKNVKLVTLPTVLSSQVEGALEIDEVHLPGFLASLAATAKSASTVEKSSFTVKALTYSPSDVTIVVRGSGSAVAHVTSLFAHRGFAVRSTIMPVESTRAWYVPGRWREVATVLPIVGGVSSWIPVVDEESAGSFEIIIDVADEDDVTVRDPLPAKTVVLVDTSVRQLSHENVIVTTSEQNNGMKRDDMAQNPDQTLVKAC